jgi:hypothetical protein
LLYVTFQNSSRKGASAFAAQSSSGSESVFPEEDDFDGVMGDSLAGGILLLLFNGSSFARKQ